MFGDDPSMFLQNITIFNRSKTSQNKSVKSILFMYLSLTFRTDCFEGNWNK
jgi:hypothetical protein